MKFIGLTLVGGDKVFINPTFINYFRSSTFNRTKISLSGHTYVEVEESCEDVKKMLIED